jgi:CRISPR-associated endonuclease Csn1
MSKNNKKLIIGLDLGIASVGISVVDKDTKKIIHRQSHLFKILSEPKTLTTPGGYGEGARGDKRRQRRTIQRRTQRRLDFISLINDTEIKSGKRKGEIRKANPKYKEIFNFDANIEKNLSYPIYELAVKGLTKELTPKELFKVLYSKLSFRGVSFTLPNEDENSLSVAEELLDILNKNKKLRSPSARVILEDEQNDNKIAMQFSLKRNKKDLIKIIDNCSYLKETNFKNDFLGDDESDDIVIKSGIFSRVRDFSQGPGSDKSRTNYGVYKEDGKQVNNL